MLSDRDKITDVVTTLAYACDQKDWETFRKLFTDDVRYDASRHRGGPAVDLTRDELTALASGVLSGFDATHHALTNVLVTMGKDEARCRTYVVAYHHVATEPGVVDFCTMRGRCDFRLRFVGNDWLITSWTVERTAPLEGSEKVYDHAAARQRGAGARRPIRREHDVDLAFDVTEEEAGGRVELG
jgi:hypothetical protein